MDRTIRVNCDEIGDDAMVVQYNSVIDRSTKELCRVYGANKGDRMDPFSSIML